MTGPVFTDANMPTYAAGRPHPCLPIPTARGIANARTRAAGTANKNVRELRVDLGCCPA